jgi:hypothetical protein
MASTEQQNDRYPATVMTAISHTKRHQAGLLSSAHDLSDTCRLRGPGVSCPLEWRALCEGCWAADVGQRPKFGAIVERLNVLQNRGTAGWGVEPPAPCVLERPEQEAFGEGEV